MTLVTVRAVVNVSADALMLSVGGWLIVRVAVRAREHQVIRRVCMAVTALINSVVRDGEVGVVKHRTQPRTGVVASLARGRESGCNVVRIGGAVVVGLVATDAGGRKRQVVVVNVALRTGHGGVESGQRKGGVVVVKR